MLTLTELRTRSGLDRAQEGKLLSRQLAFSFRICLIAIHNHSTSSKKRIGGLFITPFNHIIVKDDKHLYTLVKYIHRNPVEAALRDQREDWRYSSYSPICNQDNNFVKATEVISWFDNVENFRFFHTEGL